MMVFTQMFVLQYGILLIKIEGQCKCNYVEKNYNLFFGNITCGEWLVGPFNEMHIKIYTKSIRKGWPHYSFKHDANCFEICIHVSS
jgi:hypothetical protein